MDKLKLVPVFVLVFVFLDRLNIIVTISDSILFYASALVVGLIALIILFVLLWRSMIVRIYFLVLFIEFSLGIYQILGVPLSSYHWVALLSGITAIVLSIIGFMFIDVLKETVTPDIFAGAPKTEYAVVVDNVHKIYRVGEVEVHALRGISLEVKRGEFVAIMGPSGSGKSTLLNMIGALDKPTEGKVYIDGVDITGLDDDQLAELRNKKIGFVFQAYNLINRTTVLRNVEMPAIVAGMPKKKRVEKAKKLIKIMGLDESVLRRRPIYLSGGQQQRVAIARALMNDPALILADEPTGNLDSKTGAEVMKYFRILNKDYGVTIILVTHDRSVAEQADRILHIRDGKIVKIEEVKHNE